MCNIAGYAGKQQAAPILLEMLRKQELYDVDMSTGVATIHEGKLYCKKLVGNVDHFLQNVDLSELPGTIGIAHTRPGGADKGVPVHPFLLPDGRTAVATNGTAPKTKYTARWDEAVQLLEAKGYTFQHLRSQNPKGSSPKLKDGSLTFSVEDRALMIDYCMKQGKNLTESLCEAMSWFYMDVVGVALSESAPDRISVARTTRPMVCVMEDDATYIATTRFALPETLKNEAFDLPLFQGVEVGRDGVNITKHRMDAEPVMEMTPYTYAEGYRRMEEILKSERAPLYFDELEFAIRDMPELWPGNHTHIQHARLVYDLLWQFDREGRLRREVRVQEQGTGTRRRWYFRLED